MKKIVFFILFVINLGNAEAQRVMSDEQVEAGLETFFTRLVFDYSSSQNPTITARDLASLWNKYCSSALLKRIDKDGDQFFFKISEDFDTTTMKIKQDNKKPNSFLLSYISAYDHRTLRTIHINVLKEGGEFKIESFL